MKLSDILTDYLITTDLEAETSFEAIEELVDLMISEHELSLRNRDEVIEVVMQREKSVSTGVGGGVGIPHGTVECIPEIVGAVGVSKRGVDFSAIDGEPVHIVILLLVPKARINRHIKTMAQVARVFHREDVRSAIRNTTDPVKVLDIIAAAERDED